MAIPTIYKGDDTDFMGAEGFSVRISFEDNLDLTGCALVVSILGITHRYEIKGKGEIVCPFTFTAKDTASMPLGVSCATVRIIDPQGRVRTILDTLRLKVVSSVQEAYGADSSHVLDVKISQGGTPLPVIPDELRPTDDDSLGDVKAKMDSVVSLLNGGAA